MRNNMKPLLFLLVATTITGCSSNNSSQSNIDSLPRKTDTLSKEITTDEGIGCVFDTSMFKFTTEKLREFNKDISYVWDNTEKEASVKFPDGDTLKLSIGGCDHFAYSATYLTNSLKFYDQPFLIDKAKWLAKNFLGGGFDKKFVYCITNNLYDIDSSKDERKSLTIVDKDTSMTNKIFEPILFELQGSRTKISVACYEN